MSEPLVGGLDDFTARPGSITSLLRTFVGLHMRRLGGWIAVADLVGLLEDAGLTGTGVRSAVSRAKVKGLLTGETRDGTPGYGLTPQVVGMLERGDATIFSRRRHSAADGWCLLSYSVPEDERADRYRIRRLLAQLGCGTVADGLCIVPHPVAHRIEVLLTDAGLRDWVRIFDSAQLRPDEDLAAACSAWWDLDATADLHRQFLQRFEPIRVGTGSVVKGSMGKGSVGTGSLGKGSAGKASMKLTGREAFVTQLQVVDAWRPIPYLDPGLPFEALPADWPGDASADLFAAITSDVAAAASEYVTHAVQSAGGR